MWFAYLDASALVKRFAPETGTAFMNHLFTRFFAERQFVLSVGIAEVVSILTRKRNSGLLSKAEHAQAATDFLAEMLTQPLVHRIKVDDTLVTAALRLISTHSINSTDALLLASALERAYFLRLQGDDLLLVAADQRLLRAARAEGLTVLNPEVAATADLDALLGP